MIFNRECHETTEKLHSETKYNIKYIKNLHIIDDSLEKTLESFYKSNILCTMKELVGICQKNDILDTYRNVTNTLDKHFDLEESKNSTTLENTTFLQRIIVRVHHHIRRVVKTETEDEKAERLRIIKENFLRDRKEFAGILYNKAVTYMENSMKRKRELHKMEMGLLN